MAEALWQLDEVDMGGAHRPRLCAVRLTIRPGSTALLGASGAGKTSLLNLLVGFERPDRGRVLFHPPAGARRTPWFWVPQDHGLWPHLTVREHLAAVAAPEFGDGPVAALLAEFDLAQIAAAHPDRISQGQRARLAVARALAADPAVLVMDEPLVHVDPARLPRYWLAIERHLKRREASLVFATHQPAAALGQARDVVCLDDGAVLYAGGVDDLYWRPASEVLMHLLGDGNWLEPAESSRWLGVARIEPLCVRPHRLVLEELATGSLVLAESRTAGPSAQSLLVHEPSGRQRRFWHQAPAMPLACGARVALRVLALVACALLPPGCGRAEPADLVPRALSTWQIPPAGAAVPAPRGVAIGPLDQVLVLDNAARVLVFDHTGQLLRQWRMPESEAGNPEGACWLKDGRIAVADTHYHRVLFFDQAGQVVGTLGGESWSGQPGSFGYPVSVVQDPQQNLYVAEYGGGDRVQKFAVDGRFLLAFGEPGTGPGQFQRAGGMAWYDGRVFIADSANGRVQEFHDDGRFVGVVGSAHGLAPLRFPYDVDVGSDGRLYVIEWGACRITVLDADGRLRGRFGRPGPGPGQFRTPWGIALDSAGRLRVADTENRRIVELLF